VRVGILFGGDSRKDCLKRCHFGFRRKRFTANTMKGTNVSLWPRFFAATMALSIIDNPHFAKDDTEDAIGIKHGR